jgi:hypothetical protein
MVTALPNLDLDLDLGLDSTSLEPHLGNLTFDRV